ncbi:MAG: glycosyltransferase [Gammaproteobacteria bacterium]|nr:glycosyltransferase [Gammaproteobacteria bacterium]
MEKGKPLVTVLTPVYNGLPHLTESIQSTLDQTYKNFEFLIIDDASTDEKVIQCIESFDDPRIRFIRNEENLGVSKTMNKAISLIETPYIIRSDQDDVSFPNRVEEQLKYLIDNPDISVICSWEIEIDENGQRVKECKSMIDNYGEFLAPILLGICPIWHPSLAFTKEAMQDAGGFKTEFTRAEDFDVTSRMALHRYGAAIVPEFHLYQRQHSQSQSKVFEEEQADMCLKIQVEAISFFIESQDASDLATFMNLKKAYTLKLDKKKLLKLHGQLDKLFLSIKTKQELSKNEFKSLRRLIYRRLGLGIYIIPYAKPLPSPFFMGLFYLFSPFYIRTVYEFLSYVYNRAKRIT